MDLASILRTADIRPSSASALIYPAEPPFAPGAPPLNPGWIAVPTAAWHEANLTIANLTRLFVAVEAQKEIERPRPLGIIINPLWKYWTPAVSRASVQPTAADAVRSTQAIPPHAAVAESVSVEADVQATIEVADSSREVSAGHAAVETSTMPIQGAEGSPEVVTARVWPRPGDPIAEVGPLIARAVRDCLRSVEASVLAPAALRRWVTVTARQRYRDPIARLECLAALARALPSPADLQAPTEDLFGAIAAWLAEIDGRDALAHPRALAALDGIAATGIDPDGRLFGAAAATWRARVGSIAPSPDHEHLLALSAQQMIAALADAQVPRALMFAEVVRVIAPSVHPDAVRRSEWLGRAVVHPLRGAGLDVTPVRGILTEVMLGLFGEVSDGLSASSLSRGTDLYVACMMADLESCVDGHVFDRCIEALLLRLGVPGLSRLSRRPAMSSRPANRKVARRPAEARTPVRVRWAWHELGLPLVGPPHDPGGGTSIALPPQCTWAPPICRGVQGGRSHRARRHGKRAARGAGERAEDAQPAAVRMRGLAWPAPSIPR